MKPSLCALDRLRRIKVVEMGVVDTSTLLAAEVTAEQKEILRELGVRINHLCVQ
jgi:hypothetical protein